MARLTDESTHPALHGINKAQHHDYYPSHLTLTSSCAHRISIQNKACVNFISNNHLGFSGHPKVKEAVRQAIADYGTGAIGFPVGGTTDLHVRLGTKVSQVYGHKDTALFATVYQAHIGAIQAAANRKDAVLLDDASVHQGFVDGITLSGSEHLEWRHNDIAALTTLLSRTIGISKRRLIVVDSIFSIDGSIAPLPDLKRLSDLHDTPILTNEAHALGILGPRGYGLGDHFSMPDSVDIVAGAFNGLAGEMGGFVTGPADYIAHLRHCASAYLYSTPLPPVVCAAVLAAFELLDTEPQWRHSLWENTRYFLHGLQTLGFDTGISQTPIIPILIGDTEKTNQFNERLLELGVCASPVVYPTTAPAKSGLRLGIMATHTTEDLDMGLEAFNKVGKALGVI